MPSGLLTRERERQERVTSRVCSEVLEVALLSWYDLGGTTRDSSTCGMAGQSHWSRHQTQAYLVGSSKNMTGGLLTSSSAMARRFRWPPERLPVRVLAQGSKPRAVRISLTYGQKTRVSIRKTTFQLYGHQEHMLRAQRDVLPCWV